VADGYFVCFRGSGMYLTIHLVPRCFFNYLSKPAVESLQRSQAFPGSLLQHGSDGFYWIQNGWNGMEGFFGEAVIRTMGRLSLVYHSIAFLYALSLLLYNLCYKK
jgi:hypothetical protein